MGPRDATATADAASARRREIRNAAVRVFARRGVHATRVADIAAEAGVAHGLVYHYFSSKDALLQEIFRRTWGHLTTGMAAIRDGDGTAPEQLADVVRLMLGSYRMAPDLVRVVVVEVTRSEKLIAEIEEIRQGFAIIEEIIESGQQAGELRRGISPPLASYIVWGAIDEVITAWVFGELPGNDAAAVAAAERAVVDVLVRGLTPAES